MEHMDELIKSGSNSMTLVVVNKKNHPIGVISMRNILDAFKSEFSAWHNLLGKEGWQDAMQKGLKQCNYRLVEDYMVRGASPVHERRSADRLQGADGQKSAGPSHSRGGSGQAGGHCPDTGLVPGLLSRHTARSNEDFAGVSRPDPGKTISILGFSLALANKTSASNTPMFKDALKS